MNAFHALVALALLAPAVLAHDPPGPVPTCQPGGDAYHDYLPPNLRRLALAGDGNLGECVTDTWRVGPALDDHGATCQFLATSPLPGSVHAALCAAHDTTVDRTVRDYDGELDHALGGAILAVNTGDGLTWGAAACWGMSGHHANRIHAQEWPDGSGPAFTVTSDHSRTPPGPGPKGARADCGDNVVEPCDAAPPAPSTHPFPLNVVIDTVTAQLHAPFGPGSALCNLDDCAEQNHPASYPLRSNPSGPTGLVVSCAPGIDGTYGVWIEPDYNEPDAPLLGHVWTD